MSLLPEICEHQSCPVADRALSRSSSRPWERSGMARTAGDEHAEPCSRPFDQDVSSVEYIRVGVDYWPVNFRHDIKAAGRSEGREL